MKTFWPSSLLIALLLISTQAHAADGLEEYFYSSGKIKVVVAVAAVVMLGLIGAILRVDRKVSSLEKKLTDKK
jgi:CcmD family protein